MIASGCECLRFFGWGGVSMIGMEQMVFEGVDGMVKHGIGVFHWSVVHWNTCLGNKVDQIR